MLRVVLALMLIGLITAAGAVEPIGDGAQTVEQVFAKALGVATGGPGKAELGEQATVRLAEGQILVPTDAAAALLRAMHNPVPEDLLGLLMDQDGMDTMGVVRFVPAGLVSGDTITGWRPSDMLAGVNDALKQENEARAGLSLPRLTARRWIAPPYYQRDAHRLSWAALILPESAPDDSDGEVTYRSLRFGRDGYVELSFVTNTEQIEGRGRAADAFMNGLRFRPGKDYADATSSDPRAPVSLAAVMDGSVVRKAPKDRGFWSSGRAVSAACAVSAALGALSLGLCGSRIMRYRARQI